jgi:hypothetical protein
MRQDSSVWGQVLCTVLCTANCCVQQIVVYSQLITPPESFRRAGEGHLVAPAEIFLDIFELDALLGHPFLAYLAIDLDPAVALAPVSRWRSGYALSSAAS